MIVVCWLMVGACWLLFVVCRVLFDGCMFVVGVLVGGWCLFVV